MNLILIIIGLNIQNIVYKEIFLYLNLIIFIFNLIPIYPLDGGRIMKSLLHIKLGYKNAILITHVVSNISIILVGVFIGILSIVTKTFGFIIVIVYICSVVISENKKFKMQIKAYEILEYLK